MSTEQEKFWLSNFGADYIDRSPGDTKNNLAFFTKALRNIQPIEDMIEFGAGSGSNLTAIGALLPGVFLNSVELNPEAVERQPKFVTKHTGSMFDVEVDSYDLVITKGLLIHIHPDHLQRAYNIIYHASDRYILLCEYYSPNETMIHYRGHNDKLWKRDFAGEMLDKFKDLRLIDYGFTYNRDNHWPQDDINWFLLEKFRRISNEKHDRYRNFSP